MSPTAEALLRFIEVCKYLFMNSSPKVSLDWIQHLDSFVFQPLCCRSRTMLRSRPYFNDPGFSCQADTLTIDSRIVWYAEEFTVDLVTAGCLSLVAAK